MRPILILRYAVVMMVQLQFVVNVDEEVEKIDRLLEIFFRIHCPF
jgi:hypothetical protein